MAIYLQAIVQKKPVSYNAHLTLNGMSLMKPMVSNNALEAPLLSVEEKAHYYLVQGQTELAKKKLQEALRCFQIATELTPENPRIFFEQGLSLFDFGMQPGEEKVLLLANKQFKLATALDPDYFEAWQLWGMSLAFLGRVYNESHYFLEAEKKLIQALALAQEKDKDHLFDLYFEYGMVKSFLAKRTEEPIDWQASIQAFETASQYKGMATPLFWDAFGSSYLALTLLLGDMKWCVKAIHCFKQAIVLDTLYSEAWEHLSHALLYLYESTQDEDHFFQITECFTARAQHFPLEIDLWLSWAEFLLQSA
ncbi:MAG: hypothetical protein FJZ58_05800, partial [Chlamydiae bacterium]|nr:hypothetical protein [Chlamydiota bacterium]